MKQLMINISRCDEVEKAINDSNHPCHKIVDFQKSELQFFQHPEPWNGNIKSASILFIGSNPSYDKNEEYPTDIWGDEEIYEYHNTRFFCDYYQRNKTKVLFWQKMRKSASWLLGISLDDSNLENSICVTEIVHCKSRKEIGLSEACGKCVEKWLEKILKQFGGKYMVVFGKTARIEFEKYISKNQGMIDDKIKIIYAPHPSRWSYTGTDEEIRVQYFEV